MSGTGPFYAPADPYKQPGPFSHPGYPAGDIPMTAPYPSGLPYQRGSPYPSGDPSAPPPPYAENMGDYKPYPPGSSPYPPNSSGYPTSGPGYPPSGPGYPPSDPGYPPTTSGPGYPPTSGSGYPPASGPGYPPTSPLYPSGNPGYPAGGPAFPGYMPGGGVLVPPRPMSPPSNPYQRNTSEDQHRIIVANDGEDGWAGNSFSDKNIRHVFIRKVYLILMCQLMVTVGFVALFLFCKPIKHWVHTNMWFYGLSYAVFIVTYIVLVCCDSVRRRWPVNIICLSIFTLVMSYMTGTISSVYDTDIVLISIAITAAVCLAISIFAIQTKIDFTLCSGLIFVLAMVLILFGLACMIVYAVSGPNYILSCVYGGVAAAIFSVFLVFDTQMVVGGKHRRYQLSPEEYVYGALQLYVDVVNLFILLLGLVGNRK